MRWARLVCLVLMACVVAVPARANDVEPAQIAAQPLNIAGAKRAQRLLERAVGDAQAAYRAEGKLEMQAFSLDGTSAWDLLQKVQVNSVGDAYQCTKKVESLYDDVAQGIKLYKRGNIGAARTKWSTALRQDLPRLRTWLAGYRGRVIGLAADVNYAVTAVGKPWMANPAIEEGIDETLLRLDARLRQVRKAL